MCDQSQPRINFRLIKATGKLDTRCRRCVNAEQARWKRRQLGLPEDATTDDLRARWRKGSYVHRRSGYRYVRAPGHHRCDRDGYVLEHVLVAEAKYGIEITREFTVHHLNANKLDNRPENLALRIGQHGKGGDILHVLLARPELREEARRILASYA